MNARIIDYTPAPPITGEALGYGTDLDASLRFATAAAGHLRYVPGIGWHSWDGRRWAPGADGAAMETAKGCTRQWTLKWYNSSDEGREARVKAALTLENGGRIEKAVILARTDQRLAVDHARLDADTWLLNVENGTLDLRTGKLRPHSRADLITKLAPVTYRPDATHPALEAALALAESSAAGMADFLARCIGAALTGDATVESLFLLQGDGGSGKTTLSEGVASMLGDYACKLPFESFCLSHRGRGPGQASPDLIELRGARFAYASEGDQSARLDAGVVKMLTGGEPISARALYQMPITFPPTWKLWLVSNFDPRCDSEDSGLWRRIIKLRFAAIPPEKRDPTVKEALATDPGARSALLAWAVRGCLDWQTRGRGRGGLALPAAVEGITAEYRSKMDSLALWWEALLDDGARLDPYGRALVGDVRRHYEDWCSTEGATPCQSRRFNAYLQGKGLTRHRGHGGVKQWQGLEFIEG